METSLQVDLNVAVDVYVLVAPETRWTLNLSFSSPVACRLHTSFTILISLSPSFHPILSFFPSIHPIITYSRWREYQHDLERTH